MKYHLVVSKSQKNEHYRHIAIIARKDDRTPKMITTNAKQHVVQVWENVYKGRTGNDAFSKAMQTAKAELRRIRTKG